MDTSPVVDLTRIPPRGVTLVRRFAPEVLFPEGEEGFRAVEPVAFEASIRRSGTGYVAHGAVRARVELQCGRCLRTFEEVLESEFTAEYRAKPDRFDEDVHIRKEDLELSYLEGDAEVLNLTDVAHEQLLLLVPMKPLCSPGCRGLCPGCGADRNRTECACPPGPTDPRLRVLEAIRKKMET